MNAFTPEWTIGASRVKDLVLGNLPKLWREARGIDREPYDPRYELHAALGNALEPLHAGWFTAKTGVNVTAQQDKQRHHSLPLHATLDGWVAMPLHMLGQPGQGERMAPFEMKSTSPGRKIIDLVAREHAQLQAQMMVTGTSLAILSVLWRTPKWAAYSVEACFEMQQEIEERLALLHSCLLTGIEPDMLPEAITPAPRFNSLIIKEA
jgi:hypothetical protein